MKKIWIIGALGIAVYGFSRCNKSETFPASEYDDRLSGGSFTILDASTHAFTQAIAGLDARQTVVRLLK